MSDVFTQLQQTLESTFPGERVGSLRKGASPESIERVERALGFSLPPSLKVAYGRHDGVVYGWDLDATDRIPRLIIPYHDWAGLDYVERKWVSLREIAKATPMNAYDMPAITEDCKVRDGLYMDPLWIPIGDSGTEAFAAIDMNPGPAGKVGQLIRVDESTGTSSVIADSFDGYLLALLDALQAGRIAADDGEWIRAETGEPVWNFEQLKG